MLSTEYRGLCRTSIVPAFYGAYIIEEVVGIIQIFFNLGIYIVLGKELIYQRNLTQNE